jgi:hypothetical protein
VPLGQRRARSQTAGCCGRGRAHGAARLAAAVLSPDTISPILRRLGIRIAASLIGIALGLLVSDVVLEKFSLNATALLEATLVFWGIHIVVQFLALRVLIRQPSVALAGLLALGSTIVALIVVNAIVSGLTIHGVQTYVLATLIIWLGTAISDTVSGRMVRERRRERRER